VFHGVKYTTSLGQGDPSLVELISWLGKVSHSLRCCRFGRRFCALIAGSPTPSTSSATGAPTALDAKGAPNLPEPRVEMLQSLGNLGLCYPYIRVEHFHRAAHFFEPCWIVPNPFVNPCGYLGIPRANAAEEFRTKSSLDRGGPGRLVRGRRDQHVGTTVIDRDWHKGGRLDFGNFRNIGRDGLGRRDLARRGCFRCLDIYDRWRSGREHRFAPRDVPMPRYGPTSPMLLIAQLDGGHGRGLCLENLVPIKFDIRIVFFD
jgi:hypothetical protein